VVTKNPTQNNQHLFNHSNSEEKQSNQRAFAQSQAVRDVERTLVEFEAKIAQIKKAQRCSWYCKHFVFIR
jgi:hypothetical protein